MKVVVVLVNGAQTHTVPPDTGTYSSRALIVQKHLGHIKIPIITIQAYDLLDQQKYVHIFTEITTGKS